MGLPNRRPASEAVESKAITRRNFTPCRNVGAHRRVRTGDVLAYRRDTESHRRGALDDLAAHDRKLGLQ